jgi:hypothetical protein
METHFGEWDGKFEECFGMDKNLIYDDGTL